MIAANVWAQIMLLSWLWPLGGDAVSERDRITIESLDAQLVELPEAAPVTADSQTVLAQYRMFLELADGDPGMRMEALRRLGDLSLKFGEDQHNVDPEYADSMQHHRDAILLYTQLLQNYENYAQADTVLYQLARAHESAGDADTALLTLDRLVAEYPASKLSDEAQFRRGEILFMQRDFQAAGDAYQYVVTTGPASAFYEQSLYKHGWAQFKQAEYGTGINSFLDLLNLRLLAAGSANPATETEIQARIDTMRRADRELVEDTLRVLSLTFSYMDGADTIADYLDQRNDTDSAYLLYTSLGALYLEKERYMDAAETYQAFVERAPLHFSSPEISELAISAYSLGRFPSLVLAGKQAYVEAYGLRSDYWSFHDPLGRPDVIQPLKTNLSDLAQYHHAQAQQTGDAAAYVLAANWYRTYLDYFPADPDSAQRSFLLAEILMESQQYAEATEFYLRAAYSYPGYAQAAEAGYAAILASRATAATLQGEQLASWDARHKHQSLEFAQSFPAHPQSAAVLIDVAESYFAAAEMDEAVVIAGAVLLKHPAASIELQRVAWTVAAHGQFDLNHYRRAEIAYIELRDIGAGKGIASAELDERIAATIYRQAEAAEAQGDIDAAVAQFLRIETLAPTSAVRANATYDAATLLLNAGRWDESIGVLNAFRTTYPEHALANDVTQKLAVAYSKAGHLSAAATEFKRVAAMPEASEDVHREALWTAAELYEQAGSYASARQTWRQFVAEFPQPIAESIEVRQRLADLALDANDSVDRRDWLTTIVKADAAAGSQRNARSKTLAANASLELAEPKRVAFNGARLKMPLADSLKRKKSLMEDALSAYNGAAGYGIADVTTVATFRIAELYHQLSVDLMDSERPGDLSEDELEQYDILLEEQSFPFEEKAIELYEVNASRSADGIYDEWVASSFAKLAVLMPARYAKFEKAEMYVAELY